MSISGYVQSQFSWRFPLVSMVVGDCWNQRSSMPSAHQVVKPRIWRKWWWRKRSWATCRLLLSQLLLSHTALRSHWPCQSFCAICRRRNCSGQQPCRPQAAGSGGAGSILPTLTTSTTLTSSRVYYHFKVNPGGPDRTLQAFEFLLVNRTPRSHLNWKQVRGWESHVWTLNTQNGSGRTQLFFTSLPCQWAMNGGKCAWGILTNQGGTSPQLSLSAVSFSTPCMCLPSRHGHPLACASNINSTVNCTNNGILALYSSAACNAAELSVRIKKAKGCERSSWNNFTDKNKANISNSVRNFGEFSAPLPKSDRTSSPMVAFQNLTVGAKRLPSLWDTHRIRWCTTWHPEVGTETGDGVLRPSFLLAATLITRRTCAGFAFCTPTLSSSLWSPFWVGIVRFESVRPTALLATVWLRWRCLTTNPTGRPRVWGSWPRPWVCRGVPQACRTYL